MRPLIFKCPVTGKSIQGLIPDAAIGPDTVWVPVDCPICQRPHLINPATGKSPADLTAPKD